MELIEKQQGLRWVAHRDEPLYHEEQISFAECSGYDNNMWLNCHAALDRGLNELLTKDRSGRPDIQTHRFEAGKLPPFNGAHRMRIVAEFIPHVEDAAPVAVAVEDDVEPVKYTRGMLAAMNKEMLAALIDGDSSSMTKAEMIDAILG